MTGPHPTPKPRWLAAPLPLSPGVARTRAVLEELSLHSVCLEAGCPNRGLCWSDGNAAFLILGSVCTRACGYCRVSPGTPSPVDASEPERIVRAVQRLGLKHVVITSVTRDDLADGGAGQFAACVDALRAEDPSLPVELLIPDFQGDPDLLDQVLAVRPTILNHNLETVARLFPEVRPQGSYERSLTVLARAAQTGISAKSGILVGMGETWDEVIRVLVDLAAMGVERLTVGQYLRPSPRHWPVTRYWTPGEFSVLREEALTMGFRHAQCGPLVRSSYRAGERMA